MALHQHPELLDDCCELLNSEWPMSLTGRRSILEKSRDDFPCSLALVETVEGRRPHVIAHSRVGLVLDKPWAIWIKSVVVHKERRGRGVGKLLMLRTEEFVRRMGYRTSYLTTHDQQGFYGKLGYEKCTPVCFSGCSILNASLVRTGKSIVPKTKSAPSSQRQAISNNASNGPVCRKVLLPPPPPLPVHLINSPSDPLSEPSEESLEKTWMKKDL